MTYWPYLALIDTATARSIDTIVIESAGGNGCIGDGGTAIISRGIDDTSI